MKKTKLYCVGMTIVGIFFLVLTVYLVAVDNPKRGYHYTTSGDKIQSTSITSEDLWDIVD